MTNSTDRRFAPPKTGRPARPSNGTAPKARVRAESAAQEAAAVEARERFREVDAYRADREWSRYEGTPQRDLFRELRERFLDRHRVDAAWTLEIGPGPGRFSRKIGTDRSRRMLLDVSHVMLVRAREHDGARSSRGEPLEFVQGDGFRPPVRAQAWGEVVALGNVLGFAPEPFAESVARMANLVAPAGRLIFEMMPGTGERSRYLARLPPRAVGRLLRSPTRALLPRIDREGFAPVEGRSTKEHGFRRRGMPDILQALAGSGWSVAEGMAIAPALGFDPDRIERAHVDPHAWGHLLQIEEELGRLPERWERSAAMMVALHRTGGGEPAHAR